MAQFTDQADRFGLLLLVGPGQLQSTLRVLAFEASHMLGKRKPREVALICKGIDQFFSIAFDASAAAGQAFDERAAARAAAVWSKRIALELKPRAKSWELFAALAMWRLVDIRDLLSKTGRPGAIAGATIDTSLATVIGVLSDAVYDFTRSEQIDRDVQMLREGGKELQVERSSVARSRVRLRWKSRDAARDAALRIAATLDVPSRIEAARRIEDQFLATGEHDFKLDAIDGWLKAAKWSRPRKGVSTS